MDTTNREEFDSMKAMWLTLPGAAMCSIPVGILLVPQLVPTLRAPMTVMLSAVQEVMFAISLCAAFTSTAAYKYCISTTGHPRTRAALMIFNFIARPLAYGFLLILVLMAIVRIVERWGVMAG